jgi:hypothetical protein
MTALPQFVLSSATPHPELPPWVARFAVLMRVLLLRAQLSGALANVRLRRRPGYAFIDELGFFVAFACWNSQGSIKEFSRVSHENGLGQVLAGVLGRKDWPRDSSISRCLKSTRRENLEQFHTHVLPLAQQGSDLMTSPWVMARDSRGQSWLVFDFDGIVRAFRQRGLPRGPDLPEPVRWTDEVARPGYPGRKRGETQVSSYRLQQAGSGQWLGQGAVPGNPVMSVVLREAAGWVQEVCTSLGIAPSRVILRIDGAGGTSECLKVCREAGFHPLVRWPHYALLDSPQVRDHLRQEVWSEVAGSGAGPQRYAAELGTSRWLLGEQQPPAGTRVVASRFLSGTEGEKRGAGYLIGPAHYEVFATDLEASDWPAEDLVSLYFGRAAHENSLSQGNREMGLTRMFCKTNREGQNLAQLILMLVWNLETNLGWQLQQTSTTRPAQTPRRPSPQLRFADIPAVPLPTPPTPPLPPVPVSPPAAVPTALQELKRKVEEHAGWTVDKSRGVVCPQGYAQALHKQGPASTGNRVLAFRAPKRACALCPKRLGCTASTARNFRKELTVTVPGEHPFPKSWPVTLPPGALPTAPIAYPTWQAPNRVEPGPWQSDSPGMVAAELRAAFRRASEGLVVRVELSVPQPPTPRPPHLVETAPHRQHRRQTYEERWARNALPDGAVATVSFLRADSIAAILTLQPPITKTG